MSGSGREPGKEAKLSADAPLFEPPSGASRQLGTGASQSSPQRDLYEQTRGSGYQQGGGDGPYQLHPPSPYQLPPSIPYQLPPPSPYQQLPLPGEVPEAGHPRHQRYDPSTQHYPLHQQLPQQRYPALAQGPLPSFYTGLQYNDQYRSYRHPLQPYTQPRREYGAAVPSQGPHHVPSRSGLESIGTSSQTGFVEEPAGMSSLTDQYTQLTIGTTSMAAEPDSGRRYPVFIGNIPLETTDDAVRILFTPMGDDDRLGHLEAMSLRRDPEGRPSRVGIATYTTLAAAERAVELHSDTLFRDKLLFVRRSTAAGEPVPSTVPLPPLAKPANQASSTTRTDAGRYTRQYPLDGPTRASERSDPVTTQPYGGSHGMADVHTGPGPGANVGEEPQYATPVASSQRSASLHPEDPFTTASTLVVENIEIDTPKAAVEEHFQPRNVRGAIDRSLGRVMHVIMLSTTGRDFIGVAFVTFNKPEIAIQESKKWRDKRAKFYGKNRTWGGNLLRIRYARPADYDNIVEQDSYAVADARPF